MLSAMSAGGSAARTGDADATVTWEVFGPSGKALASVHRTGRIGGSASNLNFASP